MFVLQGHDGEVPPGSAPLDKTRPEWNLEASSSPSVQELYLTYHGIVFDFNGTLLWDMDLHNQVWRELGQHHLGRRITDDELNTKFIGRTNLEIWPVLVGHSPSQAELLRLSEEKEAAYRELLLSLPHRVTLVDGAVELFETCLAHGIEIAIGTASGKTNVDFYIETFHLRRWFPADRIVYDDGTRPGKPHPALFTEAIVRLGLPPDQCLVVEDGILGIQAARAAGAGKVYGIWADEGDRAKLATVPLDRTIHTYREMGLDDFR